MNTKSDLKPTLCLICSDFQVFKKDEYLVFGIILAGNIKYNFGPEFTSLYFC